MSISLVNETKNGVTLTYQDKGYDSQTWDEATYSWDDAAGTWDTVRTVLTRETKNSISLTNEIKN